MGKVVEDQSTRQGPKGRPVLLVLVGSLVLMGIFAAVLMTWIGADTPSQISQEASREATDPSSTSSTNSREVPAANPSYPAPAQRSANPNAEGGSPTQYGGSQQPPRP